MVDSDDFLFPGTPSITICKNLTLILYYLLLYHKDQNRNKKHLHKFRAMCRIPQNKFKCLNVDK